MITKFKDYLAKTNLAKNTVTSYVWSKHSKKYTLHALWFDCNFAPA